ncbi:alkaline phosphatase family protein [Paraburkholderia sp. BR10936]|uniref:alkaline phosphatase family protein n=1 Tax=Paraburkholderia sp. BR10936 TaxID=3236993 RepID=UPI0034D28E88
MADLSNIKHIVVLMLENRSFDNVFGYLRPADADFDGLKGINSFLNYGQNNSTGVAPWPTQPGIDSSRMPSPDPGESFQDIKQQIYGGAPAVPLMGGFIQNYLSKGGQANDIMHCFAPEELPALSLLANSFAVSDRWFASAPCQTWPNRFFVHTGTANGYTNNTLNGFPFQMQTIFNELEGIVPWKIYFHDFPQTALLSRLWPYFSNFRLVDEFVKDAAAGQLPGYSFIEPMYFPDSGLPNDMHPPHDVQLADTLVAKVYNAVRASPNWTSTLLVIVFDEHGGCYDHVAPPPAVRPDARPGPDFNFDTFGVRVPAVLISPYTSATILRPKGATPFDHTSIIRTVRNCFGIPGPLSAREAAAPDLSCALNDGFDINRGPASIEIPASAPDAAVLDAALTRPVNNLQDLLQLVANSLKPLADNSSVAQHLQDLTTSPISAPLVKPTAGDAGANVREIMQAIMARFAASARANTATTTTTIYRGH